MTQFFMEVPATMEYTMRWLERYVRANVPDNVATWRFEAGKRWRDRLFKFEAGDLCQNACVRSVPWGDVELPVIEIWLMACGIRCSVTIRCNEQLLEDWFQTLCTAIVKKWHPSLQRGSAKGAAKRSPGKQSERGCKGLPLADRDRIAAEWEQAKGHQLQPLFCAERGCSPSTLRVWYKDWKARQQKS